MLALVGVSYQKAVELLAAVTAGDDDGQSQSLTERFKRVGAESPKVLYRLIWRRVVKPMILSSLADYKFAEPEMR